MNDWIFFNLIVLFSYSCLLFLFVFPDSKSLSSITPYSYRSLPCLSMYSMSSKIYLFWLFSYSSLYLPKSVQMSSFLFAYAPLINCGKLAPASISTFQQLPLHAKSFWNQLAKLCLGRSSI